MQIYTNENKLFLITSCVINQTNIKCYTARYITLQFRHIYFN
jgi:hypothetical protein